MNIVEGDEIFVRQVLISGLDHTRPKTVDQLLTVHPGDPLNQAAMLETQRRLYNLALVQRSEHGGAKSERATSCARTCCCS